MPEANSDSAPGFWERKSLARCINPPNSPGDAAAATGEAVGALEGEMGSVIARLTGNVCTGLAGTAAGKLERLVRSGMNGHAISLSLSSRIFAAAKDEHVV